MGQECDRVIFPHKDKTDQQQCQAQTKVTKGPFPEQTLQHLRDDQAEKGHHDKRMPVDGGGKSIHHQTAKRQGQAEPQKGQKSEA